MYFINRRAIVASAVLVPLSRCILEEKESFTFHSQRKAYCEQSSRDEKSSEYFDYVIIGMGTAGQAAVKEILKNREWGQRLLILDPNADKLVEKMQLQLNKVRGVQSLASSIATFSPFTKKLTTVEGRSVRFSKCLVAVGASSPPIPEQFVDLDCKDFFNERCVDICTDHGTQQLFDAVAAGGHVTIVGANSWETIDLAGRLAAYARDTVGLKHSVTLMFPAYGPMVGSLPRYLSQAVMRRLSSRGVDVLPYSQVRYIDRQGNSSRSTMRPNRTADATIYSKKAEVTNNVAGRAMIMDQRDGLVIFTAKSYDSLVTNSFATDLIAFAPTSVPSIDDGHLIYGRNKIGHNHSFLLDCGLEIDRVGGGVLVNPSLEACNGVYVAGDVASVYLNHSKGLHSRGLYRGWVHATSTGELAGYNMTASHRPDNNMKIYNSIPIYEGENIDIGMRFIMVGNCSSALDSHGFWWKVQNHQQNKGNAELAVPPVGLGVVFYIHLGRIVGVLLSGFPTSSSGRNNSENAQISAMQSLARAMVGTSIEELVEDAAHHVDHTYSVGIHKWDPKTVSSLIPYKVADSPTVIGPPLILSSTTECLSERVLMLQSMTRRAATIVAPIFSPEIVKTAGGSGSKVEISLKDIERSINNYPRPVHRYGLSSRAFVKELTDQSATCTIRPAVPREALFQLTNNSGSREDRLSAAYSRGIINGWSPPGVSES